MPGKAFLRHILTLASPTEQHPWLPTADLRLEVEGRKEGIGEGCNIERPKVLYNRKTGKFVMWMHWELPDNYKEARCAVAVCDKIDGDYTYLGSFNPIGHMSRDCTVFQENNGAAYFISSARENLDTHIYRLSNDYLTIDKLERILWPGQQREAATVFKRGSVYFMLTSACTGWAPNQGSYAWSRSLTDGWSQRYPFGDETTYQSQPTWVLPVEHPKTGEREYLYIGDRWGGSKGYFESSYVRLPIQFDSDTEIHICK